MSNMDYFAGIDVGTSYIKVVIINQKNEILGSFIERTGPDLKKSVNTAFNKALEDAKVTKNNLKHITATGFGRRNVTFADSVKTEISCHAKGAYHYFPRKITIIDIGGQDTKIIKLDEKGKILGFKMNRKCAAGTGTFLEEIAHRLNIPLDKVNQLAGKSTKDVALSSFCTVFASTEILTRIKEGENVEDMVKSAFESVVKRVIEMDIIEKNVVMTGGVVTYNTIILNILQKHVGEKISTPPKPQLVGAIGAALFAKEAKD
jgi:predicted CoA-substrate-specific enzyme activase